jgi:AcrR family transcriptional regulator
VDADQHEAVVPATREADDAAGPGVDGRRARRDRNRVAVLDAAIELFTEGQLEPRPEAVAERSGVSLRSVYRYFSDPAELRRAAMEHQLERVLPLARIADVGAGPLSDRIDRFVEVRLRLHDAVAPAMRAARLAASRHPDFAERYTRSRALLRDQAKRHFAPELGALPADDRPAVTAAIDALVQLEGLDLLRDELGLSRRAAEHALRTSLAKLLA